MKDRLLTLKQDVSLGSVSYVMTELETLNYLLITSNRRLLKNKSELLERWVVDFNATLRPRIFRKQMCFIDQEQLKNWRTIDLHFENGSALWGGEPGGALYTKSLRPEQFTLFTDLKLSELAKTLGLVPSQDGNIEILHKFCKDNGTADQSAPPLLVYADLISSGYDRNIETAKLILENELQYIK